MTRKDYIKFANLLIKLESNNEEQFTPNNLLNGLIDIFNNDDDKFDEYKFRQYVRNPNLKRTKIFVKNDSFDELGKKSWDYEEIKRT